jgi:hypothetical protein
MILLPGCLILYHEEPYGQTGGLLVSIKSKRVGGFRKKKKSKPGFGSRVG